MKWNDISMDGYQSNLEVLSKKSPSEILNVDSNATLQEIKKAYREKMKIYHPDKNQNFTKEYAEDIGKLLNGAYQSLIKGIQHDKE